MSSAVQGFLAGLSTRNKVIAGGVAAVVVVGGVTAFAMSGGHGKKPVAAAPSTSSTAAPPLTSTPKSKPKPTPKPTGLTINPLTGLGAPPKGPIVAVKIDDTANGRPQVGLDKADIVYIEQVEGGLTRMIAVFGTNKPLVEPVRSVRASDSELLTQYGKIAVVASGGGGQSLPTLDASGLVGVINDRGGPGFGRDESRPAPYNLSSDLSRVSSGVNAGGPRDVGFRWGATDPRVARAPYGLAVSTVVGGTPVTFFWNSGIGRYIRTVGGQQLGTASGSPIATPNVIVQFCAVTPDYADVDVAGNVSQHTSTIGTGRAVLFRNGHRIEGKWIRTSRNGPTVFTDSAGKSLLLAPGGAYVLLAANGAPV
jgi:hypothetical protein